MPSLPLKAVVTELRQIVSAFSEKIALIPDEVFSAKPLPHKWSKKEVLGHLIDSGNNNLRRFICGQYEDAPLIRYNQDFWVAANQYQSVKKDDVIALWRLTNERIADVLLAMPPGHYGRACNTGNDAPVLRTLEWLAHDYVRHMKHHLNQIVPASFDVIYP